MKIANLGAHPPKKCTENDETIGPVTNENELNEVRLKYVLNMDQRHLRKPKTRNPKNNRILPNTQHCFGCLVRFIA